MQTLLAVRGPAGGGLTRRAFACAVLLAGIALAPFAGHHAGSSWLTASAQETNAAPVVRNGAEPAEGSVTLKLRELWRAGGEEDDQIFGAIATVLADETGTLYFLDTQLAQVWVYGADGTYLRTLGRQGEGPGETQRPGGMFLTPDNRVAMIEAFPGRVVMVDRQGSPAGNFLSGGNDPNQGRFGVLVGGASRGGRTYLTGMFMTMSGQGVSDQNYYLASCDLEGTLLHTFATKRSTINYADFVFTEEGIDFVWNGRWAVDDQGRLYAAPERNRYAIQIHSPDGQLLRTIEREYKSWTRSAAEEETARRLLQAIARNYPSPPRELVTLDTEPDLTALHCRPDGRLWVGTSRGDRDRPAGVFTTFDEFDANGRFARRVAFAGPGDPQRDAFFLIGADHAAIVVGSLDAYQAMQGVTGEEDEEIPALEVVYYALER
jgi:sugar lactone lactonase YvrE